MLLHPALGAYSTDISRGTLRGPCRQAAAFPGDARAKADRAADQTKQQQFPERTTPVAGTTAEHADAQPDGRRGSGLSN